MTRAKKRLVYFAGDREYSWAKAEPDCYSGYTSDSRELVGTMEDVALGWAMQGSSFNPNPSERQAYIETHVRVGDPIALGGFGGGAFKALMHRSPEGKPVQIGFLAKKHGTGGPQAALKVSAVVRFRPKELDDSIPSCIQERGWGYAVLVSGCLR